MDPPLTGIPISIFLREGCAGGARKGGLAFGSTHISLHNGLEKLQLMRRLTLHKAQMVYLHLVKKEMLFMRQVLYEEIRSLGGI